MLLYGNRKCEEIIGYRREELIGKNFLELNILPEKSLNKSAKLLQVNMEGKSSRKQILQPEVVDLNEVVSEMKNMLRRILREDIELTTVLAPELGKVMADIGQIEQVIMNLAVNAGDAMPEGGKLAIETAGCGTRRKVCKNPRGGDARPSCDAGCERHRMRDVV